MINSSIIESKFLRGKTHAKLTRTWKQTDDSIKATIIEDVNFDQMEMPVIDYYENQHHWWLITNDALYVKNTTSSKYKFEDIKKVNIPSLWKGETHKTEVSSIQIWFDRSKIELFIEPFTWPTIFNILKFVAGK